MDFESILGVAKELALSSGRKILEIYNSKDFEIKIKEDKSPLTKADTEANEIIVSGLREIFPKHGILTEEEKDNKQRLEKDFVWIIDPLDGTKEFIKRNGEFTVNIGLVRNGKPILGVVYVPAKNELFYALKDKGAFYENIATGQKEKIKSSRREKIDEMILIKSRSHASEKLMKIIDEYGFSEIKTSGSSVKGCLIAKGEADVYFRFGNTNEWDICAMHAILNEAGAKITDLNGEKIIYNKDNTLINGFIVSNNKIHEKLVEIAKKWID
jgi:3'(2'), 5'-bisphosphate nucleotidase